MEALILYDCFKALLILDDLAQAVDFLNQGICLTREIHPEAVEHFQSFLLGCLKSLSAQAKPVGLQVVPELFYLVLIDCYHIALEVKNLLQRLYIIERRARHRSWKNAFASLLHSCHGSLDIIYLCKLLFIFSLSINHHPFPSLFNFIGKAIKHIMDAFDDRYFVLLYLFSCLVELLEQLTKFFVQVDDGLEVDSGLVYRYDILYIEGVHLCL